MKYNTQWGIIELPNNEAYISQPFKEGSYWDIDTLEKLKEFIPTDKNILEIGGHVGTSTIYYSRHTNLDTKYWVFEPQTHIFSFLKKNISYNNFDAKITAINGGVFCYTGVMNMNKTPVDGPNQSLPLNFLTQRNMLVNYGGLSVGIGGEKIRCYKIDDFPEISNVGFIHCDAQGSEPFVFSGSKELIKNNKPVILYEDKTQGMGPVLFKTVSDSYPQFINESKFDIDNFCMKELGYSRCIKNFNNSEDTLLIP